MIIENGVIVEDKNICAKCGGYCCKKSGCGYVVSDFKSLKYDDLKSLLDEGNISIKNVSVVNGVDREGRAKNIRNTLVLKARSVDKDVVDLFSASTQCKMLKKDGCAYDLANRPTLGKLRIPVENMKCYQKFDTNKVVKDWERYGDVLKKLVKTYTGKSAEEVFKEQYVATCAMTLAKFSLAGDTRLLPQSDIEVLETFSRFQNVMANENQVASFLARKIVNEYKQR